MSESPLVLVLMGSKNDWDVMQETAKTLQKLQVPFEAHVASAHRTPDKAMALCREAEGRGLKVVVAAAGGAAHLAGVCAGQTHLPVLGVPMKGWALDGMDALLSTVQMPAGIPVGTLAVGKAGAINAALLAAAILSLSDPGLRERLLEYRRKQTEKVLAEDDLKL